MYRITCYCGKTDFYRTETTKSWVNRKCKKCKSNLIIYQNETLVSNYNIKKDRVLNHNLNRKKRRVQMKQAVSVFNQEPQFQLPMFPMFVPILPNPVKKDVFMGYHGQAFEFEIQPFVFKPIEMDIDIDIDTTSEFDKYNL